MLKVIKKDGEKIYAWDYNNEEVFCPECNGNISFIKEHLRLEKYNVVGHFRHKVDSCGYGVGESKEHLEMKAHIFHLFKPQAMFIDTEYKLPSGRIADIFLITKRYGKKIIIECQVSPMSLREFRERNRDYNNDGCYILWILSDKFKGKAIKNIIHRIYIGVIHYLIDGEIILHNRLGGDIKLNDLKSTNFLTITNEWEEIDIAKFYNKAWWKH